MLNESSWKLGRYLIHFNEFGWQFDIKPFYKVIRIDNSGRMDHSRLKITFAYYFFHPILSDHFAKKKNFQ